MQMNCKLNVNVNRDVDSEDAQAYPLSFRAAQRDRRSLNLRT